MPADLFAAIEPAPPRATWPEAADGLQQPREEVASGEGRAVVQPLAAEAAAQPEEASPQTAAPGLDPTAVTPPSQADVRARGGVAPPAAPPRLAKAARPGFALYMRTADGEEAATPFRSLDDLLSAARPILRTAARSPEPVWFSIQPVDLADLDSEAA